MKIAIIGTGVAGSSVLKYLSKAKKLDAEILLFDDQKYIGKGRAFQYDDPELLMNYPGNLISMKPNKPQDFINWIEKHQDDLKLGIHKEEQDNQSGNEYYSRQLFGQYMADHFEKFAKKKNVTVYGDHVRNIEVRGKGYVVSTQNETYEVDAVFLSPGQFGPMDPYQLAEIPNYFSWPYPLNRIEVEENKDYAVIGTGLSSVDIVRYLTPELNTTLYLVSRDGKVQSVRGEMAAIKLKYITRVKLEKLKNKNNGFIPLEEMVKLFNKEAEYQGIASEKLFKLSRVNPLRAIQYDLSHPQEVGLMQSFIYELTRLASYIWPFMTRADKDAYIDQYAELINAYANPMPESSAQLIAEGIENNRIVILSEISEIEYKYNKFRIHTKDEEIRVHYVINATGPAKDYKEALEPNPLIENLVNQGMLIAHPDGGFYVTPLNNEVIAATGQLNHFYMLGQKTGGVNYLNNGIVELSLEAQRVVEGFIKSIQEG
ncbi:FAD/NAD(P)-binding protein [Macrococcus equi]|uniref:FAD/NAD(P)-binding protein n=1 Tax=Macrococcus equi TaxID=3395462 RepID=UPI0039BE547C